MVIDALLQEARTELDRLYGDRLERVVLFGSYARDEAVEGSDIDLLLVLRGNVNPFEEIERTSDLGLQLLAHYHKLVSFLPVSVEKFEDPQHPLMMNVHAEGIEI